MATDERFRQQVDLLIRLLPSVAEENVFALKGVNERLKLTRFQRLNLTHLLWRKAPSRAALI